MKHRTRVSVRTALLAASALTSTSFFAGCGASSPKAAADGGIGLDKPTSQPAAGTEVNPDGVPYPAVDVGYQARSGTTPGNRIKNYRFLGYRNSNKGAGLSTISLADYFDPQSKRYKVIHVIASSVWCGPCQQETQDTVVAAPQSAGQGVAILQALLDGPVQGLGATSGDLSGWVGRFATPFTTMLDPDAKNLGQFFDAAAVPWNAVIDARSMEILQAGVGAVTDVASYEGQWLQWVAANPARP